MGEEWGRNLKQCQLSCWEGQVFCEPLPTKRQPSIGPKLCSFLPMKNISILLILQLYEIYSLGCETQTFSSPTMFFFFEAVIQIEWPRYLHTTLENWELQRSHQHGKAIRGETKLKHWGCTWPYILTYCKKTKGVKYISVWNEDTG